jgi:2,3-bisphosphoglycerate-dependent phosphoglycerate mutase
MPLLLVRHCSALGQEPEAPLTPAGEEQATVLAHFLADKGVRRILSSPFKRALDSATPLADALGLPIEIDHRLAERKLGHVEDGDWLSALHRSFENPDLCLPTGESSTAAQLRGRSAVDDALAALTVPTAVFSHGNLISLIANSFDNAFGFEFWASLSNPDVWSLRDATSSPRLDRLWGKEKR